MFCFYVNFRANLSSLWDTKPILPDLYDYITQASILRLLKNNLIITRGYTRS